MNEVVKSNRAAILQLHEVMEQFPSVDDQRRLYHHFAHKVYVRELATPADTLSVSKIHKFSQVNALLVGKISIKTLDGKMVTRVAPCVWVSPAGSKSLTYYHEDTIWISAHGTDETDIDKVEDTLVCKSFEEFDKMEVT